MILYRFSVLCRSTFYSLILIFTFTLCMDVITCVAGSPINCRCDRDCETLPENCSTGILNDTCSCCRVCARESGDPCGGVHESIGRCKSGLECIIRLNPGDIVTGQEQGVCVEIPESCKDTVCDSIHTHRCPVDSLLVYNGTVDGPCCNTSYQCMCDPDACKIPKCVHGHELVLQSNATGRPGSCCDKYKCKVPGCTSNVGKIYKNFERWKEGDCVHCSCVDGKKRCQAEMCSVTCLNPRPVPGRCCPVCDGLTSISNGPDIFSSPGAKPEPTYHKLPAHCNDLSRCTISCSSGLQQLPDGCFQCRCKPDGCYRDCRYGYVHDGTGREICECLKPNGCPSMALCTKKCTHGFRRNRDGCLKCRCNKCPTLQCNTTCLFGFMKDRNGCDLCKCKESPLKSLTCKTEDGKTYKTGETWVMANCTECMCTRSGLAMCAPVMCPVLTCTLMIREEGKCCPSCLNTSLPVFHPKEKSTAGLVAVKMRSRDSEEDLEQKYIISLAIVGVCVVALLVLVFVLLYLRLKQKHQARWSLPPGGDAYCTCPLFTPSDHTAKYTFKNDFKEKYSYDPVAIQTLTSHPCVEVSLKEKIPSEELNNKLNQMSTQAPLYDQNSINLSKDYGYRDEAT